MHIKSYITDLEELKDDIKSRIWITYRRNFQNIGKSCIYCSRASVLCTFSGALVAINRILLFMITHISVLGL